MRASRSMARTLLGEHRSSAWLGYPPSQRERNEPVKMFRDKALSFQRAKAMKWPVRTAAVLRFIARNYVNALDQFIHHLSSPVLRYDAGVL